MAVPDPRRESIHLLLRAQEGDNHALEELLGRYLPRLEDWASGRLPVFARDLRDTRDIVQETLLAALRNLDGFQPKNDTSLLNYLRCAVNNRIRDEVKRVQRRPEERLNSDPAYHAAVPFTPLDHVIGTEVVERYERALASLKPEDRDLVVARFEFDLSYEEIAEATGRPNAQAARMAVTRAFKRLAKEMDRLDR